MSHPNSVTLSRLFPDDTINVRKTAAGPDPGLIASIKAKGITTALTVRPRGQDYAITDGRRRYLAAKALEERGELPEGFEVPILVRDEGDAAARDTSLTTAIVRAPLHPVDRVEAFADLQKGGMSSVEIAAHYGLTDKEVRQCLALGQLSAKVREAWRAGEINAEAAQAFTLAPSTKEQDRVLDRLKKDRWGLSAHTIRQNFLGKQSDVSRMIAFVGVDAVRAAGGKVNEDLFGTNHTAADPKAVAKIAATLARERLTEECEKLTAAGWSWAMTVDELPQGADYSWGSLGFRNGRPTPAEEKRLKELRAMPDADGDDDPIAVEIDAIESAIEARTYTAAERARAGCIVSIGQHGELTVKRGILKPEEKRKEQARERTEVNKAKAADRAKKGLPDNGALSNALMQRLSEQLTAAAGAAIIHDPTLALAALLAGIASREKAVDVKENGLSSKKAGHPNYDAPSRAPKRPNFAAALQDFIARPIPEKMKALALVAGNAIDLQVHHASQTPLQNESAAALCNAIDPKVMKAALREAFDAKDYFDSVAKPLVLKAIAESLNEDEARKVSGKPKADVVKFALANVPKTGWLPPELRTGHYDGPGATAKVEKAKPARKSKPASKGSRRPAAIAA